MCQLFQLHVRRRAARRGATATQRVGDADVPLVEADDAPAAAAVDVEVEGEEPPPVKTTVVVEPLVVRRCRPKATSSIFSTYQAYWLNSMFVQYIPWQQSSMRICC